MFNKAFEPFTPGFFYKLIQLNSYSIEELFEKNDELSLVMLLNRIQNMEEFRELNIPKDYLKNISEHGTDETLNIIGKVIAAMLRHLQVSEEEIADFTGQNRRIPKALCSADSLMLPFHFFFIIFPYINHISE